MPIPAHPYPADAADRFGRLARRIGRPARAAIASPWSPPPLNELIARIDGALAARRAG